MSTAILEGYGDLIIHDGNTDFTIVKPTPFATNSTKVKRWWRQNYNVVTYEACAIVELLDFYIVVSCAQDVQLKMTFDGTSAVTFDVGYDKPGDGNIERILVVPKTEFHNPVNYDDYYYDYSTRELRKNSYGNGAVFDIFLNAALDLNFAVNKSLVDSISGNDLVSFTRASSGTFVGADGLIKSTSVNFALNSNIVQGSSIGTSIPNSTESVVSPRGIIETVRRLGRDVPAGGAQVWRVGSTSGGTPNTTYTISFYAKTVAGGTTTINVDINDTTPTGGQGTTITGEWTRITKTGGSANNNLRFFDMNMVTATADFYVWGAQIEIGTTATDYIPTTSTISGAPRFDHINTTPVNLVTYSEQLDQWITGSNSTVTANAATAPNGTYTADRLEFPQQNSTFVSSNSFVQSGKTYTASVYVKAVTPGTNDKFTLSFGGQSANNATSQLTATGEWQRFTATKTPTLSGGSKPFIINNEGDGFRSDIYVWGAQVEEGSVANDYIPTTNTSAAAAITTVESLGLLIEESRTNKIYYSQDLTTGGGNLWKLGDGAFTGTNNSSPLAPDGVSKMWLVNLDSTSGTTNNGSRIYQSGMAFGSVVNVFSFYARSVSGTGTFPAAYWNGSNYIKIYIPLTTTTTRYIIYIPANTGGSIVGFSRRGTTHDETLTQAYVWGCQCEEGNFVTSYIPTFGSQATRAADIAEITGTNFSSFYNTDSNQLGTMFVHAGTNNPNNFDMVEITNGQIFTRDTIRHNVNDGVTALTSVGGGQVSQQYVSSGTAAIKAAGNSILGFAVNGTSTVNAGNQINNNGNFTMLVFGRRSTSNNTEVLNGHIKRFAYFSTNLDVNTLKSITT